MSDWTNQLSALLQQGQQFGQGMSNAAAGTVSAPVDGIAWLLRKAGAGNLIGNAPIGGSDWMAQQGLTRPTNGLAGLLGESVGGVAPMLAAAKAPQIGNALMRMGENAAAPSTLGTQRGAIVYHGSPHTFDSFDMSKIGTGEGAQAYGHGLYFADSPATAKSYQEALSSTGAAKRGLAQAGNVDAALADAQKSVAGYQNLIENGGGGDPRRAQSMLSIAQKQLEDLQRMKAGLPENTGSLYKVDLPDEHIAKMLDWDKPLSQQPHVMAAIKGTPLESFTRYADSMTGGQMVSQLGNDAQATAKLKPLGIPGIRYLDQGSRTGGAGTSNYVVFDDALPQIVSRNGLNP